MKTVITGVMVQVEQTVYNDDGKVVSRPKPAQIVALEADIPEAVVQWLQIGLAKSGGA